MNKNIIDFYLAANKLKNTVRTGWQEVGVPENKVESVAEHICCTFPLILGLISEKDYSHLDLVKVLKMLLVRELPKTLTYEQSITSSEDKKTASKEAITKITGSLSMQNELLALYDEAIAKETEEAKFVDKVTKLESDLQAKIYEMEGSFTLDRALEDVANYPQDLKDEILPQVKKASDGWLLFDRKYYEGKETFVGLSKDIQEL